MPAPIFKPTVPTSSRPPTQAGGPGGFFGPSDAQLAPLPLQQSVPSSQPPARPTLRTLSLVRGMR
eukprot:347171-Hanusia_phi.AAC.1